MNIQFQQPAPKEISYGWHKTPCGYMMLALDETNAIRHFDFAKQQTAEDILCLYARLWPEAHFIQKQQLTKTITDEAFKAPHQTDICIRLSGSVFQEKVWKAISQIPFAKTKSYSEIANAIECPKAQRAVGTACGANPVPLFIPCHRVIASNGRYGGFGGGLELKKQLLSAEGISLMA